MEKERILVFHPAIAPYRLRFFNDLYDKYDAKICLYYNNVEDNEFSPETVEKKQHFVPSYSFKKKKLLGRQFFFNHTDIIENYKPTTIIASEFGESVWISILFRVISRKKYKIITMCDDSRDMAEKRRGLRKISRDFALKMIDGVILCNDNALDWYKHRFNNNYYMMPIIQDESDFLDHKEDAWDISRKIIDKYSLIGKRVFLFVGRLSPEKNLEYLIHSFISNRSHNPENVLFIVGGESQNDPGFKSRAQRLILDNKADDIIYFIGRQEGIELKAWYYAGQVLVLPSISEAFGAVVNEALLAGEEVMVSSLAGASCLVTSTNGEIIDVMKDKIDFINISNKIRPINKSDCIRESKMPYRYQEKIDGLFRWLEEK